MPIAVTIEDGTGVENSNSVVTAQQVIDYAILRGITGVDEEKATIAAIKAMDVLISFIDQYIGKKAYTNNFIPFPRLEHPNYGTTEIPQVFIQAQLELSYQSLRGLSLEDDTSDSFLTERTLGPITRKFKQRSREEGSLNKFGNKLAGLLGPLLSSSISGGLSLISDRG